jgi:hypothetical protein
MSEQNPSDEVMSRLTSRAKMFKRQPPPKLAALLPFKAQIKELRARNAAYDDIRLILVEEKIMVTLDAIYRFCRDVLGEKPNQPHKVRLAKKSPPTVQPGLPSPPANAQTSIQAVLQERRERLPGLWGRRKRGPRIADSKNL